MRKQRKIWTPEEEARLEALWEDTETSRADMVAEFDRTWRAIAEKANFLGFSRTRHDSDGKRWKGAELEEFRRLYTDLTNSAEDVARHFGIKKITVYATAEKNGIKRPRVPSKRRGAWGEEDLAKLADMVDAGYPIEDIAEQLNRRRKTVKLKLQEWRAKKAARLDVRKANDKTKNLPVAAQNAHRARIDLGPDPEEVWGHLTDTSLFDHLSPGQRALAIHKQRQERIAKIREMEYHQ